MIASPTIANTRCPEAFAICQLGFLPQVVDFVTRVPQCIDTSGVYAVSMIVCSYKDLKCGGVIYKSHSKTRRTWYIRVVDGEIDDMTCNEQKSSPDHQTFDHVKCFAYHRSSWSGCTLTRYIHWFERRITITKSNVALIIYNVTGVVDPLGVNPFLRAHGNSKQKSQYYVRTKPTVLSRMAQVSMYKCPKKVVSIVTNENGGVLNAQSAVDLPRNRQQVYNMARKQNKEGRVRHRFTGPLPVADYHKIVYLAMAEEHSFLRNYDFDRNKMESMSPRTFACPPNYQYLITQFCSPQSQVGAQVGIDMTYNIGPFFATTLTMQHPMFVIKVSFRHPAILLAVLDVSRQIAS